MGSSQFITSTGLTGIGTNKNTTSGEVVEPIAYDTANFADDTVLTLLTKGRTDHPWANITKTLPGGSGIIAPVFNWQVQTLRTDTSDALAHCGETQKVRTLQVH